MEGHGRSARVPSGGNGGRVKCTVGLLCAFLVAAQSPDYLSFKRKLDLIENEKLKPGRRVAITARELNAYVQEEVREMAPQGVRDPRLELGIGRALGFARIDFLKVKQAQGGPAAGWLLQRLLEGERPVAVTVRIESGGGKARVDVERVEVSGVAIEGAALDFLIRQYVIPNYPEAKVGQPFELAHHVDRMEITPGGVGVVIGKR